MVDLTLRLVKGSALTHAEMDANLEALAAAIEAVGLTGILIEKTQGLGIKVDSASPSFPWADLLGSIRIRTGGATAPTFKAYRGNIYQFGMGTAPGVTEVFNEYHIPHDWLMNSVAYIHAHWSTIAAPTGNIEWNFEILYAKGYAQDVFEGTDGSSEAIVVTVTQAAGQAFRHEIAEVQFTAPNGLISPAAVNVSITSGTPTLTAAAALFDNSMIGRTVRVLGAGAAGGNLDTTISAFTSSTQVTLAANASTTVTAQDAFRFRVLDSANIEPDGLLLVRSYRNSADAADTLDVEPFVHFIDVHYQSTGIGTKQRNGPAFWT